MECVSKYDCTKNTTVWFGAWQAFRFYMRTRFINKQCLLSEWQNKSEQLTLNESNIACFSEMMVQKVRTLIKNKSKIMRLNCLLFTN